MRVDQLSMVLGEAQNVPPHWKSARQLFQTGDDAYRMFGEEAARKYGLMLHYTASENAELIWRSGAIGLRGSGAWLTPTAYSACMASPNLGLNTPRDLVLVLDVARVSEIWGPGASVASRAFGSQWRGGGIEFYVPSPLSLDDCLVDVIELEPCGGGHR